jgi:hypothetical protein
VFKVNDAKKALKAMDSPGRQGVRRDMKIKLRRPAARRAH